MRIGTKSILFGAHCFFLHPFFVAAAWTKLYGFPFDPRLWAAFLLHDIGYLGKRDMDGPEGETHVELGAMVMGVLFDRTEAHYEVWNIARMETPEERQRLEQWLVDGGYDVLKYVPATATLHVSHAEKTHCWEDFTRYHSRFYAKRDGHRPSRLCMADKLALVLTPWWLYLPLVRLTGEIDEYMRLAQRRTAAGEPKYASARLSTSSEKQWYFDVQQYLRRWVEEHRDGREDTWTPAAHELKGGVQNVR